MNAIVYDYTDDALAEARRADDEVAAGRGRGPLHGVPVTIKENVDQQGKPTPNGVPAFEKIIAPDDAPLVRNLRKAGAIIVGRTNTPELSMRATTDNPLHGRTRNPWHPDASPGLDVGTQAGPDGLAVLGPLPFVKIAVLVPDSHFPPLIIYDEFYPPTSQIAIAV